jgi:hypothetical protein
MMDGAPESVSNSAEQIEYHSAVPWLQPTSVMKDRHIQPQAASGFVNGRGHMLELQIVSIGDPRSLNGICRTPLAHKDVAEPKEPQP